MHLFKSLNRLSATVALATIAGLGAGAHGAIYVTVSNPGASTYNIGDTITARISASTDNPNGIASLATRVTTSVASQGGTADTGPLFRAAAIPESGTIGSGLHKINFNPALSNSAISLVKSNATWVESSGNLVPNSTTGNRPVANFVGNATANQRGPISFVGSSSSLTWFADVQFKATSLGTVYFSLSPNPPSGTEYTTSNLSDVSFSTVTPTVLAGSGFAITVVPEPGVAGLFTLAGGLLAMHRRRRA